jgi:16S rRNA processing protein RimM
MAKEIPDGFVAVARILGAWGVRGAVSVEAMAAGGVLVAGREVTVREVATTIERVGPAGGKVRLKLAGIDEREDAAVLWGEWVLAREDSLPTLPEGEFYRFQLLGLRVVSTEGQELGTIEDVFSTPENDVYVVRGEGGEVLIPAVEDVVTAIDLEAGVVTVEVIQGLLG